MSRAEVEAILGGPGERRASYKQPSAGQVFGEQHVYGWVGGKGDAWIEFASSTGPEDRVVSADFLVRYTSARRDPMRSLRAWLGR
jgi:hypothetical protein